MLQGRVDDIYRVLASNSARMQSILRTGVKIVNSRARKGSSSKKSLLAELQNTNITIEDEAENKSVRAAQRPNKGQAILEAKSSSGDSYKKELIPLLNIPERKWSVDMVDPDNMSKISTEKPQKATNSKLEGSFYKSESKGDQSIYEKILANIRFTKRSQEETPRSKRPVKYRLFKTPVKEEHLLTETSKQAASGLRYRHSFAQSKDGLLIYESEQARESEESPQPNSMSRKYKSSQSQLRARQRRAYIYNRSIERSYSGMFDRRRSLARSCSQL